MDDIYYEKVLNRIIQGRLRLRLGDLVLFIEEPCKDIIERSFDIYEDARKTAFYSGVYIKQEVLEILLEHDMWTPLDDKEADRLEKEIENLKVEAFQSFVQKSKLAAIKRSIRNKERQITKLKFKKHQFDHVTCSGLANFARKCWIIQNTTKTELGESYDFKEISISSLLEIVADQEIQVETFRKIARTQPFRGMWNLSKKTGDLFGGSAIDVDKNKLALISYAQMYDSVYENPESPKEEVIEDDDCLDGWFIQQRRKHEKDKKQSQIESMISNEKVANSDEIFLMASNKEDIENIYSLNDIQSRSKVRNRQSQIESEDKQISFTEFHDVKQDLYIQARNEGAEAMKNRAKGR
jgi:hypothetical protein